MQKKYFKPILFSAIAISSILFSCSESGLSAELDEIVSELDKKLDGNLTYSTSLNGSDPMPPITLFYDGEIKPYTCGFIAYSINERAAQKGIRFSTYEVKSDINTSIELYDHYYLDKVIEKMVISDEFITLIEKDKLQPAFLLVDNDNISIEAIAQLSKVLKTYKKELKLEGLKIQLQDKTTYGEILYRISDDDYFYITFNLNKDATSIVGFGMNPQLNLN